MNIAEHIDAAALEVLAEWRPEVTKGMPWTSGPWETGEAPDSHCRIYASGEAHAVARTYGRELNGVGICRLTGPENAADAGLIAQSPLMAEALMLITMGADELVAKNDPTDPVALQKLIRGLALGRRAVMELSRLRPTGRH